MGAEQMTDHLDALLSIIIDSLQDQSSALKREIALRALRQLVSGTATASRLHRICPCSTAYASGQFHRPSSVALPP